MSPENPTFHIKGSTPEQQKKDAKLMKQLTTFDEDKNKKLKKETKEYADKLKALTEVDIPKNDKYAKKYAKMMKEIRKETKEMLRKQKEQLAAAERESARIRELLAKLGSKTSTTAPAKIASKGGTTQPAKKGNKSIAEKIASQEATPVTPRSNTDVEKRLRNR